MKTPSANINNFSVKRSGQLCLSEHEDGHFSIFLDLNGTAVDTSEPVDSALLEMLNLLQLRFGEHAL